MVIDSYCLLWADAHSYLCLQILHLLLRFLCDPRSPIVDKSYSVAELKGFSLSLGITIISYAEFLIPKSGTNVKRETQAHVVR
jgi:hypothetical protein